MRAAESTASAAISFAMDPVPTTCSSLRPINVCGDGCCDSAEAERLSPSTYCRKDCTLARLELIKVENRLQLLDNKLKIATLDPEYLSVTPACR